MGVIDIIAKLLGLALIFVKYRNDPDRARRRGIQFLKETAEEDKNEFAEGVEEGDGDTVRNKLDELNSDQLHYNGDSKS